MNSLPPSTDSYYGFAVEPQAVLLAFFSAIALCLLIPSSIIHIKAHNLPNVTLILSVALLMLQNTINPMIWPNDNIDTWFSGEIFCDVEVKLQIGITVAITGAATCICRNLASVIVRNNGSVVQSSRSHRIRILIDVTLCLGLPFLIMGAQILIQADRYLIFGITGCQYSLARNWVSVLLIFVSIVLVALVGAVYCVIIVVHLLRHQHQVSSMLHGAKISNARFIRIFVFAALIVFVYTPITVYFRVPDIKGSLQPYRWDRVHRPQWSQRIELARSWGVVRPERWIQMGCGYAVFLVFGLGSDAVAMYKECARRLMQRRVLRWPAQTPAK